MNEPTDYKIKFEQRDGYLYAFVTGDKDSLEISISFWRDLAAECSRVGAVKLLIEESFPNYISQADMFTLGELLPQIGLSGVKVAFVDTVGEHHQANKFGELVAVNRGFHSKVFIDRADAETWLLGG